MTRMEAIFIMIQELLKSDAKDKIVPMLNAIGISDGEIMEVLS